VVRTKYFRAEVKREGEWWSIRIPELSNLTTQARSLLDAEDEARGRIASHLGIGRDAFAVEMEDVGHNENMSLMVHHTR
jgi:predicted RNase H-like HicB family nuclease